MKVLKIEWHHNIFLYSFFFWAIKASDGSGTYPKIDFSDAWIKLNKGVFKPVLLNFSMAKKTNMFNKYTF